MKKIISSVAIILVIIIAFVFQKISYDKKIISINDTLLQYENEISDLAMLQEKLSEEVQSLNRDKKILLDENERQVKHEEELKINFSNLKYDLMTNNLTYYWNYIWEDIYKSRDNITETQIDDINFLFQPTYNYQDSFIVNPLCGYFASYYNDIKDIDLGEFLRYSPIGTVPKELPEIKLLSKHSNWPFDGEDNLNKLPVPIHRFERNEVQSLFSTYAGINLDELSNSDFHLLIYLESTDAYYNYTSDFGPASFKCKTVEVKDNTIKLFGANKNDPVLTIVKINNNYFIKSHNIM